MDQAQNNACVQERKCQGTEGCCTDCMGCPIDPRTQIKSVMQFMFYHNASHINELEELAKRLEDLEEDAAAEQVSQSVSDFKRANQRLSDVLAALERE